MARMAQSRRPERSKPIEKARARYFPGPVRKAGVNLRAMRRRAGIRSTFAPGTIGHVAGRGYRLFSSFQHPSLSTAATLAFNLSVDWKRDDRFFLYHPALPA